MFEVASDLAFMLIVAGFLAGFIDAIAGGGGLITIPALLLAGANPMVALGTNKLQGSFGSASSTFSYARAGHVNLREQLPTALISLVFSSCGAMLTYLLPVEALRWLMPIVLILVALFFAFRKGLSDQDRVQRLQPAVFAFTAVPLVAAYDGFFGPGAGSFFMMAFVLLAGYGMLKATAHTKFLNFASNIGALLVFIPSGGIWWVVGLSMGVAQILGATLGAKVAMRVGGRLIKPMLVITSTAMALRLMWQAWTGY